MGHAVEPAIKYNRCSVPSTVLTLLGTVLLQKNILGLVQGPPCRIDVDFKDEKGRRYHKTAVVKGKNGETEELPLYTNHDHIYGEVGFHFFTPALIAAPLLQ
jgi:hypothetical protein